MFTDKERDINVSLHTVTDIKGLTHLEDKGTGEQDEESGDERDEAADSNEAKAVVELGDHRRNPEEKEVLNAGQQCHG